MSIDLPPPVPAASAAAAADSCSVSDSDPRIDRLVAPVYTEAMHERNKAGVVDVSIDLRPDGTIAKATITLSSGDALLDGATYNAALATTYRPAVRNCQYIAGSYIFRARYRSAPTAPAGGDGHAEPDTPGPFAPAAPLAAPTPAPGTAKGAAPPAPAPSPAASPAPAPSPAPAAPVPTPAPSAPPSPAPSPAPAPGSAAAGTAPVPGSATPAPGAAPSSAPAAAAAPSPAASAAPANSR
jgi:TonB family protein